MLANQKLPHLSATKNRRELKVSELSATYSSQSAN